MSSDRRGLNVVEINGATVLLTTTSGGVAVHLTKGAEEPGSGRGAVWASGGESSALTEPCWAPSTVCGRVWVIMVGGLGGGTNRYGDVAFAPTCGRCLELVDRHLPRSAPDPRVTLVAQIAADLVVDQRGYVEILDVPDDRREDLRNAILGLIKQRTSLPVRSSVGGDVLRVECQAIAASLTRSSAPQQDPVISWAAWDVA